MNIQNLFRSSAIPARLFRLSLVFAVPLAAIIIYQIVNGIYTQVDFARLELAGNAYQRSLEPLLEKLPLYALSLERGGDLRLRDEIDQAFAQLAQTQAELGPELQVSEKGFKETGQGAVLPENIRKDWESVRSAKDGSQLAASLKTLDALTHQIVDLIAYVGTTSNLILDPEMDSYFLGDFTLNKMPQTQLRLANLMQDSRQMTFSDIGQQRSITVYAAMIEQDDLNPALSDISTCLTNNGPKIHGVSQSLQTKVPPAVELYKNDTTALVHGLQKWLDAGGSAGDSIPSLAAKARETSFEVWGVAIRELDVLLQRRIEALEGQRNFELGLTFLTLGLASWIARRMARRTNRELQQLASSLGQLSQQLVSTSSQLSSSSQEIALASCDQAAALEQTSASLEEISSMGKQNAGSAAGARNKAGEARVAAEEGAARTATVQSSMGGVNEANSQMERAISGIKDSSQEISKIIKTIDEIAFQTNILALNAAVEAARAGQAGAGFAVVAEEVRNLAERSARAAKEIASMIEEAVNQSSRGVVANERMTGRLTEIYAFSSAIQTSLAGIAGRVREVDELVQTISGGAKEQSLGLEQITVAVSRMDESTQSAARVATQTASASEDLARQATLLVKEIGQLEALINGPSLAVADYSTSGSSSAR